MSDLQAFPSLPQSAQVEGSLPLTLTLSLSLLGHHVATDTEVQPLQSWLQPDIGSIPQSVVHSKGPQHDSDNCEEEWETAAEWRRGWMKQS